MHSRSISPTFYCWSWASELPELVTIQTSDPSLGLDGDETPVSSVPKRHPRWAAVGAAATLRAGEHSAESPRRGGSRKSRRREGGQLRAGLGSSPQGPISVSSPSTLRGLIHVQGGQWAAGDSSRRPGWLSSSAPLPQTCLLQCQPPGGLARDSMALSPGSQASHPITGM